MTFRFGDFELDKARRELRHQHQPLVLQPRVFDLLALLIAHRDRVVRKEELLERLWPDVVVGDGSLQRAVSLARAALKQGGMQHAIRNYARQGYRFCLEPKPVEPRSGDTLAHACEAFERCDWSTAIEQFREADRECALHAVNLERFAEALECAGRAHESLALLERAAAAFAIRGDSRGSARCALRLAHLELERGRGPIARGWLNHGLRYLVHAEDCWEHGFAAFLQSRIALTIGDFAGAAEAARTAIRIGQATGSEDAMALGRLYLGYAELAAGRVEAGLALTDEAAAMVVGGNVSAWVGALLYCGLIWLCCNRGDWQRAAQWNDSFARWCERGRLTQFSGLCRLHRAEVLGASGHVDDAEAEIASASPQLALHTPWAEGDAFRLLGDLRLLRGDLSGAEQAFKRAHELGWDPQPGLAMLWAEQGDAPSAVKALRRAIDDPSWALQHRRGLLLARLASIAARHGYANDARNALAELEAKPQAWSSDAHRAAVSEARAEWTASKGHLPNAVALMREAVRHWRLAASAPSLALARFRLAGLLAQEGDINSARLELDCAHADFESLGAPRRAEACVTLRAGLAHRAR